VKDRRRFPLTSVAGVLGAPLAAGAQQARKMFRSVLWRPVLLKPCGKACATRGTSRV
jgi:hypothetical protein